MEMVRWSRDHPLKMIFKISIMLILLFAIGLLPGIDNYAHLCGFCYGLFIYFTFRPFRRLCGKTFGKKARIGCGFVSFILGALVMAVLVILFYVYPIYKCDACSYFNCIPVTSDFCDSMQVTIQRTGKKCMA